MADTNLLILAREFKALRTYVQEAIKMSVSPQKLQGEKGEQGVKGDTGAPGKAGKDGKDGINGLNGVNGKDGKDGEDGLDGVGIQNAYIDFDSSLVIVLTTGQEINAGFLSQEAKDTVMATFKQGASTLNELLPSQTGNTGKVLTTNGTSAYWATASGGGGGSGGVCSAWVNFNGTGTVAIRNQFNVSSITDNGVGTYTVNFTTNLLHANYATLVSAGPQSSAAFNYAVGNPEAIPPTVSGVRVAAERSDGAAADLSNFSVAVFS